MILTILLWILAAAFLLPALCLPYFVFVKGHGGGKVLDLLLGAAIFGGIGVWCLISAIRRTF